MTLRSETQLASFDIVNSTDIYDCPDMLRYLRRLRAVTGKFAITSMGIMPPVSEKRERTPRNSPSSCVFLYFSRRSTKTSGVF
jgi:hypothetical protein